jgi:ABC-type multidrug transport system fused ATPase/permease subunit
VKREYWKYFKVTFPYLKRRKGLVAAMIGLMLVGAAATLLEPWPLALLVDTVLGTKKPPSFVTAIAGDSKGALLLFAVLAGFGVVLLVNALSVVSEYVTTTLDQNVALEFRSDLYRHCQNLSQAFHDETTTGDSMYRINFEAKAVGQMSVALPPLLQSVLMLVGMFVIVVNIDPTLALISLVVVPFVYASTNYYGRHIEPRLIDVRNLESRSLTIVNETFTMLRVICAFNRQGHEHEQFRTQGKEAVDARVNITVRQTLFSLAVALSTAAGIALVLGFGALGVLHHQLSVGELLVVMAYIHSIYQPLETISSTLAGFQESLIGIRFAKELLDVEPEVVDMPGAVPLPRAKGDVEFRNVSFRYKARHPALRNISLHVDAGEIVGIVGPTGAGKSTLVSLLPRFLDPSNGSVLLDGLDLRSLTVTSVRDQISLVQQEPLLFPRSIEENIRYGRMDASEEEVVSAAMAANAHDFISSLPYGYRTKLGERGTKISGGERQRLTIARAFLRDSPVLILDEPTSSVDSRTEEVILDALDRLMEGRTTFIVAHRLSTLRRAHRIVVINEGKIVELGTHAELLLAGGLYAHLASLQGVAGSLPAAHAVRADTHVRRPSHQIAADHGGPHDVDLPATTVGASWTPPKPPSWAHRTRRVLAPVSSGATDDDVERGSS